MQSFLSPRPPAIDAGAPPAMSPPGCATYLRFALMAGWAIGSTVLVQAGAWLAEQFLLLED